MNKIERLLKRFDVTGIEYDDEFVRYKLTDRYDWEHTIVYTIWGNTRKCVDLLAVLETKSGGVTA